jgi:predicted nucleotidyltransferase
MNFDLDKHTILKVVHGSHAYGTNLPTSDHDYKGVAIPPEHFFLGFTNRFEQAIQSEPDDVVIYGIQKFFKLASDCNPNIIEVLFGANDHVVVNTPLGERLRECAHLFLSKKARHTFAGYAHAQLKRIKTHRRWLLEPPKAPPSREAFGLQSDRKALSTSVMGAMESLLADGHEFGKDVMRTLTAEKRYTTALQHWKQYQDWLKQRNPKRAELEAKHGYDTKHAMHLVRLMRMCAEILEGKGVIVFRPDAGLLLDIRAGMWSYDKLVEWAEEQDERCAALYEISELRNKPDRAALDSLCISLVQRFFRGGVNG